MRHPAAHLHTIAVAAWLATSVGLACSDGDGSSGCTSDSDCENEACLLPDGEAVGSCATVDCWDADGDGVYGNQWCPSDGGPFDCDDTDPTVHPYAVEACNLRDDDCDGEVDEDVPPQPCPLVLGVCADAPEIGVCRQGQIVGCLEGCPGPDCPYGVDFDTGESDALDNCGDGLDNDCDGLIDIEENLDGEQKCSCVAGAPCGDPCTLRDVRRVDDARCACRGARSCGADGRHLCLSETGDPVPERTGEPPLAREENCDASCVDDDCDGLMNDGCRDGTTRAECEAMFP